MGFNFPNTPSIGDRYPVPPTEGVPQYRWDGEKWTATTPDSTAPSPPFESTMAYSGMQINGGMEVSQENGSTPVLFAGTATKYVLDGWNGSMVLASGQVNIYQQSITNLAGFTNCLQMATAVAQATLGGGDFVRLVTRIEGYRFSRMAWGTASATPLTISFWARASVSGTYRALMQNFDGSLTTAWVPFAITGGTGNFQYVTITFPAQTTGTWKTDNTIGAHILIEIASSATANTVATSGYFSITGVTVLPGTQAPTAAQSPNIMRPYDQELVTCQRYFQQGVVSFSGGCTSGQTYNGIGIFKNMRAGPTLTAVNNYAFGFPATGVLGFLAPDWVYESRVADSTQTAGMFRAIVTADARL